MSSPPGGRATPPSRLARSAGLSKLKMAPAAWLASTILPLASGATHRHRYARGSGRVSLFSERRFIVSASFRDMVLKAAAVPEFALP